jgi:hypothetical protein
MFQYQRNTSWFEARASAAGQMRVAIISEAEGGLAAAGLIALGLLFLFPVLSVTASHARDGLTDWRASVLPRYRSPQLCVGLSVTLALTLLTPLLLYAAVPFSPLSLLAISFLIAATIGLLSTLPPKAAGLLAILMVAIAAFRDVRVGLDYMLLYQRPGLAASLLIISTAALAFVWTRLALLPERPVRSELAQGESLRLSTSLGWRRSPGQSFVAMPQWRRVRLWRIPTSPGILPAACAIGMVLLVVALAKLPPKDDRYSVGTAAPVAAGLAGLSLILPLGAIASEWSRRLPFIGYELTRPISRRRFVRDIASAYAMDWFSWWSCLTAGGFVAILFALNFDRREGEPLMTHAAVALLTLAFIASALMQVLLGAVLAFPLRTQSKWAVNVTAAFSLAAVCALFITLIVKARDWPASYTLTFLSVLALSAVSTSIYSYRSWLRADLA